MSARVFHPTPGPPGPPAKARRTALYSDALTFRPGTVAPSFGHPRHSQQIHEVHRPPPFQPGVSDLASLLTAFCKRTGAQKFLDAMTMAGLMNGPSALDRLESNVSVFVVMDANMPPLENVDEVRFVLRQHFGTHDPSGAEDFVTTQLRSRVYVDEPKGVATHLDQTMSLLGHAKLVGDNPTTQVTPWDETRFYLIDRPLSFSKPPHAGPVAPAARAGPVAPAAPAADPVAPAAGPVAPMAEEEDANVSAWSEVVGACAAADPACVDNERPAAECTSLHSDLAMPERSSLLDTRRILAEGGCDAWVKQLEAHEGMCNGIHARCATPTMSITSLEISNVATPHTLFVPRDVPDVPDLGWASKTDLQKTAANHVLWHGKRLNLPNIRAHFSIDGANHPISLGTTLYGEELMLTGYDANTGDIVLNHNTRVVGHVAPGVDGQPIRIHDGMHTAAGLVYIVDRPLLPHVLSDHE